MRISVIGSDGFTRALQYLEPNTKTSSLANVLWPCFWVSLGRCRTFSVWRWCLLFSNCDPQGLRQAGHTPVRALSIRRWKTASPDQVAVFQGGNLPSAPRPPKTQCVRSERKPLCSVPSSWEGHFSPASPAPEGFDCTALVVLPFLKFIFVLGGRAIFPLYEFHYI